MAVRRVFLMGLVVLASLLAFGLPAEAMQRREPFGDRSTAEDDVAVTVEDGEPAGLIVDIAHGHDRELSVDLPSLSDDGASLEAQSTDHGARALIHVDRPDAPTKFEFPVSIGGRPAQLRPAPGGAVDVLDQGTLVASFAPPWAYDAVGEKVDTHFEIRGSTVVQIVDHVGATYPVVADPDVRRNCGRITCTWYWSVSATHRLARGMLTPNGDLMYGVTSGVVCLVLAGSGAGGLACGLIYHAGMNAFARQLSQAHRDGRCFTVSTPPRATFGSVSRSNDRCSLR